MNEIAMNARHFSCADEAPPIERAEDDVLTEAELARLACLAERPELECFDLANAQMLGQAWRCRC